MRLAAGLAFLVASQLPSLACRPTERSAAPASAGAVASAPRPQELAGTWQVDGVTTERRSGSQRTIGGRVVIALEGDAYESSFHLATQFPTPDGPMAAEVIGKGDGAVAGERHDRLDGRAETQIVVGSVPGVDSGFAFVPRSVGTRIVSKSTARLAGDGSLEIEIESEPAPGERYESSRTVLRGHRLGGAELGTEPPPVAAPPPAP